MTEIELSLRQKTLLLFLDSRKAINPVRVQKGMFLFAMKTPELWLPREGRYDFEPRDYGAYSSAIRSDLNTLTEKDYIYTVQMLQGESWNWWMLTDKGFELLARFGDDIDHRAIEYLQRLRKFVDGLSFTQLLSAVYKEYPEYAVNSVFRGTGSGSK